MDDKDFTIDESLIPEEPTEIIDDAIREAVRRMEESEARMVAMALHEGYDGVDIEYDCGLTPPQTLPKFSVTGWHSPPPRLERYPSGVRRYDFTHMTDREKKRLLSIIGVQEVTDGSSTD